MPEPTPRKLRPKNHGPARGIRATAAAAAVLALALALLAQGCGGSKQSTTTPNFSASDLSEEATGDWITNGGSSWNERYSTLDSIDTANVSKLRGVWRTHLRGSGADLGIGFARRGLQDRKIGVLPARPGFEDPGGGRRSGVGFIGAKFPNEGLHRVVARPGCREEKDGGKEHH